MKRKEIVILVVFACLLAALNIRNLIRKQRLRNNYRLIVEAGKLQISLNAANTGELEDLPGIGPVIAERIIDYREKEGGYDSLEELKKVKGIGDRLYHKILPHIRL